jgi:hypothetical protein
LGAPNQMSALLLSTGMLVMENKPSNNPNCTHPNRAQNATARMAVR